MDTVIVRYGEIGLKGRNRHLFENQLRDNIARALNIDIARVKRLPGQLTVAADETTEIDRLARVFGVAWYARAHTCPNQVDSIARLSVERARRALQPGQTFAVRAARGNKQTSFTSPDVQVAVGRAIQQATNAPVDLDHPDHTFHVYVGRQRTFIHTEKMPGPGGLPVGSSPKVLCLLSGGFDSIAAAYLMAKRGARVDFLHFQAFLDNEQVLASKMPAIWNALSQFTLSDHVYLAPYTPFQMMTLDLPGALARYELVTFRRLMARVGEALAARDGYHALVLGDSLGQVASQTMDNMIAVDDAVRIPVFRPLIGFDKLEVMALLQDIGLYDLAVADYRDCCSIISAAPATEADLTKVREIEERIKISALVSMIVERTDRLAVGETLAEEFLV